MTDQTTPLTEAITDFFEQVHLWETQEVDTGVYVLEASAALAKFGKKAVRAGIAQYRRTPDSGGDGVPREKCKLDCLNYEGAMSDLDSALTVLIRRINGEADLASAAEWVRLNYPNRDMENRLDKHVHEAAARVGDRVAAALRSQPRQPVGGETLQSRVQPWMTECFGPEVSADRLERNDRFIEEALELVQASDYPKERAHELVEYVYGRPKGDIDQEVGGVMITLAAHCLAHGVDMHEAGETELARIWTKVEQIREKQKSKPKGSALPIPASPPPTGGIAEGWSPETTRWLEHNLGLVRNLITTSMEQGNMAAHYAAHDANNALKEVLYANIRAVKESS